MSNKDFFELVKAIGESKSKQEEDRIIAEEVIFLKKKIPEVGTSKKKMKEYLIRAIYVEMLGQDASFAYIKAVELCASTNIIQKKAGYLAASLFLSPDHEFRFMLVNQIQRDMASSNYLEASAALSAITKIITADTLPAILTPVVGLLSHANETIRKKTVTALHRLHQIDPYCLQDHTDKIRRALCDKDPAVMGASLVLLLSLITADPYPYKDLVSSFISILKQITEHRLPREFDYHRIPAPWIQMHLLRILAVLGRGDQSASEGMYEVLVDVMRRADTGINVGYAIVYECVRTITSIYPNPLLLDAAATSISRFIRSEIRNLKYMGIKGLTAIVKEHVKYAADHQMAVIDCLEDPDETLKRKTLDLLYRMTNSVNVEFIVDKLLSFLATATDDHFRSDLVNRITQCAEKFASSHGWYVSTMVRVFYLAGDKIKSNVAQTLMQLIAEGEEEEEEGEEDGELRPRAVEDFILLVQKQHLPPILAEAVTWVLGEYGYLSNTKSKEEIMGYICNLCQHTPDITTIACGVTAMMKLVAQTGVCPPAVLEFVNMFSTSCNLDIMQRCLEFKQLLLNSATMADVLPIDASCEDIQVDESLAFLDGFVSSALAQGASPYSPPNYNSDEDTDAVDLTPSLKVNPYAKPTMPVAQNNISMSTTPAPAATLAADPTPAAPAGLVLGKNVAQVWGKKVEPPPPPTPAAAPAAAPATPTPAAAPKPAAATPPAPPAATPASPPQPREPTEREKMAAALFGGISSSAPVSKRRSSATTATWAPPAASSPTTTPAAPSPTPASPPQAPAPAPAAAMDLLDLGYTPSAPPAPTPVSATTSVFDSMTLTPTPMATSPATSPPPAPASPALDVFANLDTPTPTPTLGGSIFTPLVMTTRDFGGRWGHTPAESKCTVTGRSDIRTLEAVRAIMQQKGMHHVESIPSTNEVIFAASLATPIVRATVGSLILLHIKLIPARNEALLTVRTGSKELTGECLGQLAAALQ